MSLICDLCDKRKTREDFSEEGTIVTTLSKTTKEDGRIAVTEITLDICDDCLKSANKETDGALLAKLAGAAKYLGATAKQTTPRKPATPKSTTGRSKAAAKPVEESQDSNASAEEPKDQTDSQSGTDNGSTGAEDQPVSTPVDASSNPSTDLAMVDPTGGSQAGPGPAEPAAPVSPGPAEPAAGASTLGSMIGTPPGGDDSEGDGDGNLQDEF